MSERGRAVLRRLWPLGKYAIVLALLAGAAYWFLLAPTPAVPHVVGRGELVAEVMGTGTLDSHVKATLSTKIPGRLVEVLVDQGHQVRTGQPVARLDDRDLRHQVEIEEANVTARMASVERLVADRTYAQSVLRLAASNHERSRRLIETRAISQEEYDRTVEAKDAAEAGLTKAEAAVVEGQKQFVAAEKTLDFHRARLVDTVIAAPFDGLIVRRDRDPGDVVVPGSSILSLVSVQDLWVRVWVDETRIGDLKADQPVRVVFRSEPDVTYQGRVVRLGRETDRETREFLVDVRPERLPGHWTVGQRAEVYVETARKSDVTLVPARLVAWRDGVPGVFVAADGRAKWRGLTLGLRGRDAIEVLDGLTPGEVVLEPGDPRTGLADGRRVALP